MLKLVEKYGHKPPEELPLLFHRILQNTLRDHFRRQKIRSAWTSLLSNLFPQQADEENDRDPLDKLHVEENASRSTQPHLAQEQSELIAAIEAALSNLSPRQREAFLLRYWEDLDIAETARIMGCTDGSVKTHCSRAVAALSETLTKKGISI